MPNVRNSRNDRNTEIIKLGTMLIFQLRQLITGDSLVFVLAGNTNDGVLKESSYSQDQIFSLMGMQNFRVSFSNAQIELASCIESLKRLNDANLSLAEQWRKILRYGFVKNPLDQQHLGDGAYHKKGPDINVYMKFVSEQGKRRTLTYYYMMNGEQPRSREELKAGKSYDRGWMYQWLKMNQDIDIDDTSLTPLLPLMQAESSVRENVAGIKSGDFGSEQYKFRNRRIITLNNMQDILLGQKGYVGIIPSLTKLLVNWSQPNEALGSLIRDFTTMNEIEIQKFVEQRVKDLNIIPS